MTDQILLNGALLAARLIQDELVSQSPVKTGALRESIRVTPVFTEDKIIFRSSYEDYGVYVDLGTGPYYTEPTNRRTWNPRPEKGTGGIIPRFWTSLNQTTRLDVMDILARATAEWTKFQLRRNKIRVR